MKKRTFAIVMMIAFAVFATIYSCNKEDDDDENLGGGGPCLEGSWNTLDDCIQAKINAGVDDECECKTDNWPDGPWYMVPDDK